jgi:F-type H+-transporting ATPase subunit alpha
LFNSGFRPAVDVGISVSRVGSAAQPKSIKSVSGKLKLELAQFAELEAFAQFASDLDEATRKQLERGQRATELMKQKQYSPLSVSEMALSLFAVNEGFLDDVDVTKIGDYESALHDFAKTKSSELLEKINETGDFNDDIEASLKSICEDFSKNGAY